MSLHDDPSHPSRPAPLGRDRPAGPPRPRSLPPLAVPAGASRPCARGLVDPVRAPVVPPLPPASGIAPRAHHECRPRPLRRRRRRSRPPPPGRRRGGCGSGGSGSSGGAGRGLIGCGRGPSPGCRPHHPPALHSHPHTPHLCRCGADQSCCCAGAFRRAVIAGGWGARGAEVRPRVGVVECFIGEETTGGRGGRCGRPRQPSVAAERARGECREDLPRAFCCLAKRGTRRSLAWGRRLGGPVGRGGGWAGCLPQLPGGVAAILRGGRGTEPLLQRTCPTISPVLHVAPSQCCVPLPALHPSVHSIIQSRDY